MTQQWPWTHHPLRQACINVVWIKFLFQYRKYEFQCRNKNVYPHTTYSCLFIAALLITAKNQKQQKLLLIGERLKQETPRAQTTLTSAEEGPLSHTHGVSRAPRCVKRASRQRSHTVRVHLHSVRMTKFYSWTVDE